MGRILISTSTVKPSARMIIDMVSIGRLRAPVSMKLTYLCERPIRSANWACDSPAFFRAARTCSPKRNRTLRNSGSSPGRAIFIRSLRFKYCARYYPNSSGGNPRRPDYRRGLITAFIGGPQEE